MAPDAFGYLAVEGQPAEAEREIGVGRAFAVGEESAHDLQTGVEQRGVDLVRSGVLRRDVGEPDSAERFPVATQEDLDAREGRPEVQAP